MSGIITSSFNSSWLSWLFLMMFHVADIYRILWNVMDDCGLLVCLSAYYWSILVITNQCLCPTVIVYYSWMMLIINAYEWLSLLITAHHWWLPIIPAYTDYYKFSLLSTDYYWWLPISAHDWLLSITADSHYLSNEHYFSLLVILDYHSLLLTNTTYYCLCLICDDYCYVLW